MSGPLSSLNKHAATSKPKSTSRDFIEQNSHSKRRQAAKAVASLPMNKSTANQPDEEAGWDSLPDWMSKTFGQPISDKTFGPMYDRMCSTLNHLKGSPDRLTSSPERYVDDIK